MRNMGFFHLHRTSSSSSSRSTSSAVSTTSSYTTPRSSTDSGDDVMAATLKPQFIVPRAPLLNLPYEILQHIANYLDNASAATFSLSNRHVCYAIGTRRLASYIQSSSSRLEARERLENTIERALPGAWHCAWCDSFHPWSPTDSPTSEPPSKRPCAEYNSYLTDNAGYTLRYHHIRLALAHSLHGPPHGLPLTFFTHSSRSTLTLFQTPMQTSLSHSAKISNSAHFLLHTSFSLLLPTWAALHKNLIGHLWPVLPPLLTQHRASEYGHSGLMAAVDNVARRGWKIPATQSCSECAAQFSVTAFGVPRCGVGEFVRLDIRVWRDLGTGRSPFEGLWRAQGVFLRGAEEGYGCGKGVDESEGVRALFEDESRDIDVSATGDEEEEGQWSWLVEKNREEERNCEREWRAIYRFLDRRAGIVT